MLDTSSLVPHGRGSLDYFQGDEKLFNVLIGLVFFAVVIAPIVYLFTYRKRHGESILSDGFYTAYLRLGLFFVWAVLLGMLALFLIARLGN